MDIYFQMYTFYLRDMHDFTVFMTFTFHQVAFDLTDKFVIEQKSTKQNHLRFLDNESQGLGLIVDIYSQKYTFYLRGMHDFTVFKTFTFHQVAFRYPTDFTTVYA